MTQPPTSGPWGAQSRQEPGNWQGYPGGQQVPQGQWNPQQQWPAPAPQKKGPLKWIVGALALVGVIAVTPLVAVSCGGGKGINNGGGGSAQVSDSNTGVASANDIGPVSVITEDPSCAPWGPIATTVANAEKNGWTQLDHSISATAWTPEMRAQYQAVGEALTSAANEAAPLAKLTTRRVMRELYQQYVAYIRFYSERIPQYTAADNDIIRVGSTLGDVITGVCQSISFGPAAARAPFVASVAAPEHIAPVGDTQHPERFLTAGDSQCADWQRTVDELNSDPAYSGWNKEDPSIPASSWSPEYKAENISVMPVLSRIADSYETLARKSTNPAIQDFGILAAQYGRAFVKAIPTYTQPDSNLYDVFRKMPAVITTACKVAGSG